VPNYDAVDKSPGSSLCPSLQELYSEVAAIFASERLTFDVEEMANAIRVKDSKTFSRTVQQFCTLDKDADSDGALHSLISTWRDEYGGTLIHLICRNMKCNKGHDSDKLIRALVSWNAELLRVQDILRKLPIHLAVEQGQARLSRCNITRTRIAGLLAGLQ
ncbi:hypothetical protein OSTOST_04170, partial [Ostertagia ostertagi]